jgi:hypothetical protein
MSVRKKKPSVFGKKIDNILKQKEARYKEENAALNRFKGSVNIEKPAETWKPEKNAAAKLRFLIHPNDSEAKKKIKPKWSNTPNFRRYMQAGIWVRYEKSYRIFKLLHLNPTVLRASQITQLQNELQSVFNPIKENVTTQISIKGYTLLQALSKLSISLSPGDRLALVIQLKYKITGEDGDYIKNDATSYVENFDEMRPYKTMLSALIDGMSKRIRGFLADKELTFTNHKSMDQIYSSLLNKTNHTLAKYGLEYIPDATSLRMANMVLESSGYSTLQNAKDFGDKKVIKDYESILETYMSEKQLEAKLSKDEINKVSIFITYVKIPRNSRKVS